MIDLFTETDVDRLVKHIKDNYNPELPLLLWVDLFCGFGGIAEGYKKTQNNFIVAGVNHDRKAVEINMLNHPNSIPYIEDVRDWGVIWKLESLIAQLRVVFPSALVGVHASLECTFFSPAKGGDSRDEDSRTLGYHLEKYLSLKPDYITVENVPAFRKWGPVYHVSKKENGKTLWKYNKKGRIYWSENPKHKVYKPFTLPIKERECEDYEKWKAIFKSKGFKYDYRISNAADFGEYTRRIRYFSVFAKGSLPITFPDQTHIAKEKHYLKPHLKIHNAVREKLNLKDVGVSVFGLNKQGKYYSSKTVSRVLGGCKKFNKQDNFTSCYYGASQNGQGVHGIDQPINTITTKDRFCLHHIQYAYGKPTYSDITEPLQTITTVPKPELVTTWLFDTQFGNMGASIDRPCPTIIARQDKKPLYIVNALEQNKIDQSIAVEGDCQARKELRQFMRENGIFDVTIRQLYAYELAAAQGFPETYILDQKSSTRSKKFIGNSVCPGHAKANSDALYGGIVEYLK